MSRSNASFNPLSRLIAQISRWIRRQFGRERSGPIGELVAKSELATLYRISNTEPGVCGCWWICHRDAGADLVISLINLQRLREDLGRLHRGNPGAAHSAFSAQLSAYLASQGGLSALQISHIFVVVWKAHSPSIQRKGKDGRYYRANLIRPLVAIPGDFQGVSNAWTSGDRYALGVAETIGRRLLRLEPSKLNSWEDLINAINWYEWLEFYLKSYLGQSHVFQPKRGIADRT